MNDKAKVLIIDDDIDIVAAMRKILESKGLEVEVAYDTDEGGEKLSCLKPDVIILDVMFGSKGESKGFDFAGKVRLDKKNADIPILMLTAINEKRPFFSFSPETDGEFLPVDAFLDKPVRADELFQKVDELIKQKTSKWTNWPDKK